MSCGNGSLESALNVATINRRRCEPKNHWAQIVSICNATARQLEVEFLHDGVIRMLVDGMVGLIKYKKAYVCSEMDIAMPQSVQENLRRRNHNAVLLKNTSPESRVQPLVWFLGARNLTDGYRKCLGYYSFLLVT
jgi:hypothetical protein